MCNPDATLVIPQRGQAHLTIACLLALRHHEAIDWPVIVVDDGSTDDAAYQVRATRIANSKVIEQPPRGVTAAWNAGLRRVETEFALLLNNDVRIAGPLIKRLIDPLRSRQAIIAGVEWREEPLVPRTLFPDRRVLAGWCFACGTDLWRNLGGFDASLRLYFSDVDLQCRAAISRTPQSPPTASAGPLPIEHLSHQTTQHDPGCLTAWHADRSRFVRKWNIIK